MKEILFTHIGTLAGAWLEAPRILKGQELSRLPVMDNAWLRVRDGRIHSFGTMDCCPAAVPEARVVDVRGRWLLPSWCDSHTHIVYAGSREGEFVDRIRGLSYEDIAARGGGILNSAARLAKATEQQLFESASERLGAMMRMGTGAVEIKSGYGLDLENELKMLRVIKRLAESHALPVKATLLAAHALPPQYRHNRDAFITMVVNELIPAVAAEHLAQFIDVFCEKNYFSADETAAILDAGARYGLVPKVHVNQFNITGGVEVCVQRGARSVDHLELVDEKDIEALQDSDTMPVALPGCSFFIHIPYTPARQLIDAGLPLALATDFNPGSAPSGNMNFVGSLACIHMRMLPEEVLNAGTLNGAYAMQLEHETGTITPGKLANFWIARPMPSLAYAFYHFGQSPVDEVYLRGERLK